MLVGGEDNKLWTYCRMFRSEGCDTLHWDFKHEGCTYLYQRKLLPPLFLGLLAVEADEIYRWCLSVYNRLLGTEA